MPPKNLAVRKSHEYTDEPLYYTWDDATPNSKQEAYKKTSAALQNVESVVYERADAFNTFVNIVPGVTVREGTSRRDYNYFRPQDAKPRTPKGVVQACMNVYKHDGLIRNVIDTMSDFTVQGIDIVHPNKKIEAVYKAWAKKIHFKDRSERIANMFYKAGNVVIKMSTAFLNPQKVDELRRGMAGEVGAVKQETAQGSPEDMNYVLVPKPHVPIDKLPPVQKYELPWRYTVMNPMDVEVVGEDLSTFVGHIKYVLRVPSDIIRKILRLGNSVSDEHILNGIPPELLKAVRGGKKFIGLDPNTTFAYHYKKDDYETWASPFTYSVLDDIILLHKTKLADMNALDGATSRIRVWKLGNLEHKIVPAQGAYLKLRDQLTSMGNGGTMDLIWGPDLTVQELSSDTHKFLGKEKYAATLNSIYAGLGIPPTLTGSTDSGGFTNSYISLKTLIERLNYGRAMLIEFWEAQFKFVQRALGYREPAQLVFGNLNLSNEDAEKALLIQLADRNIISMETLQKRFGEHPNMERQRIKREMRDRSAGKLPEQASPYHRAQLKEDLERVALQRGLVTPEDLGIISSLDTKSILSDPNNNKRNRGFFEKGNPDQQKDGPTKVTGEGRPKGKKDTTTRKQKNVVPRSKASELTNLLLWTKEAHAKIANEVLPAYLHACGKKNARQLTTKESDDFEQFKFGIMCKLEPYQDINQVWIDSVLSNEIYIPAVANELYKDNVINFMSQFSREPSVDDLRHIYTTTCATILLGEIDDG